MTRRHILLIVFGILGFLAMFWSAADWYELMRGDRMNASFCALNSYWNCDRASLSRFGSIGSIPLGVFGMFWFWAVVILAFGAGVFRKALKLMVIFGLFSVIALGTYLIFYLHTGCLICYATYICILVTGVIAFTQKENPRFHLSSRTTALSMIAGFVVLALFAVTQTYRMNNRIDEGEFQKWYQSMTMETVPEVSPLKKGNPEAKIVLYEFSDFGCPFCEKVATILNPYLSAQDDIRVVYYPFPLDSSCNPNIQRVLHPHSCDWAKGSICANEQNKFWDYHDRIFKKVSETEKLPPLQEAIGEFDLDLKAFDACMAKQETADKLRQMIEVGTNINLQSTPTLVIAGRKVQGFVPLPLLRRLLLEIRRADR